VITSGAIIITTGSFIAMCIGRTMSLIVAACAAAQLLPPPIPPTLSTVLATLGIALGALIFLMIGDFLAFYLAVLANIPHDPGGAEQANKLQKNVLELFDRATKTLQSILTSTGALPPKN
jgi:hypothetical protein